MKQRQPWTRLLAGVFSIVFLGAGCSHGPRPVDDGRKGILEKLAEGATSPRPRNPDRRVEANPKGEVDEARLERLKTFVSNWAWPLKRVQITSSFGQRQGEFHEGIDFRARVGTPVYAAHAGVVIYSGRKIRGYGKLVVIRHKSGLSTIYAHNSRLLVHRGQRVRRGQEIAVSGNTGKSHGPHLHFEVRDGLTPINPLALYPSKREVAQTD